MDVSVVINPQLAGAQVQFRVGLSLEDTDTSTDTFQI